jgi:hypothetical protein
MLPPPSGREPQNVREIDRSAGIVPIDRIGPIVWSGGIARCVGNARNAVTVTSVGTDWTGPVAVRPLPSRPMVAA